MNFLLPILAAIPLVGYLIQTDVPGLSFIQVGIAHCPSFIYLSLYTQENYRVLHMVVSDSLKSHVWTVDKHELIMSQLDDLFPQLYVGVGLSVQHMG